MAYYCSRHGRHAETNLQAKTETKIISCTPNSVITTATGCAERRTVCCAHGELWFWVKHWEAPRTKCKECVESNRGNKRRCGSLCLRADQHHLLGLGTLTRGGKKMKKNRYTDTRTTKLGRGKCAHSEGRPAASVTRNPSVFSWSTPRVGLAVLSRSSL